MFGKIFIQSGRNQLLHAQPQLPLCLVHFEHLGLDDLPNLQHVLRVMDAFLGADLAHVDHAFHPIRKLHERAELGEAGHRSFDYRARRKLLLDLGPGIAQRLLEAQREAAFAHIHAQDHRFHRRRPA